MALFSKHNLFAHRFKGGCCTRITVCLLDCRETSFLILFGWSIKNRLWQFDESLSDEHPCLYPTCQSGMNCPSHQSSPLILLVKIMESHRQRGPGEKASNNRSVDKKKKKKRAVSSQFISIELCSLPSHFTRGVYVICFEGPSWGSHMACF